MIKRCAECGSRATLQDRLKPPASRDSLAIACVRAFVTSRLSPSVGMPTDGYSPDLPHRYKDIRELRQQPAILILAILKIYDTRGSRVAKNYLNIAAAMRAKKEAATLCAYSRLRELGHNFSHPQVMYGSRPITIHGRLQRSFRSISWNIHCTYSMSSLPRSLNLAELPLPNAHEYRSFPF